MRSRVLALSLVIGAGALTSTAGIAADGSRGGAAPQPVVLRLATPTSTADTGLLAAILPEFEKAVGCRVDVVAVGTGQALEIGHMDRGHGGKLLAQLAADEGQPPRGQGWRGCRWRESGARENPRPRA